MLRTTTAASVIDGISYDGYLVTMGMINPHPALKAASEQACMGDTFLGDDFFHNGAFRLSYAFEYARAPRAEQRKLQLPLRSLRSLRVVSQPRPSFQRQRQIFPRQDSHVGTISSPIPSYDEYWKHHAVAYGLKEPTVPNLNVAGWWDQEDFYGPVATYQRLETLDKKNINYLVAGPWNHGGWGDGAGKSLGEIPFGSDTALYFRQKIEAPFFAFYLKDKGSPAPQGSYALPDRQRQVDAFRFLAAARSRQSQSLLP